MFPIFNLKVTNNMVNQNMKRKGVIPDIVYELGCIKIATLIIEMYKKIQHICIFLYIVEAEMSQKLSWRDLFVQIEFGVDIASLGIK